ncbi:MAG: SPOR domain-containing protein [Succinivibrionaceae bacterium]
MSDVQPFVKCLVGGFTIITTITLFSPMLFPNEENNVTPPKSIEQISQEVMAKKNKQAIDNNVNNKDLNNSLEFSQDFSSNNMDADTTIMDGVVDESIDEFGYGDLLADEGEPPLVLENDTTKSGVVVGVVNPTVTGNSRADIAKKQEEIKNQEIQTKERLAKERELTLAKAKAEKEAQRAQIEAAKKSQLEAEMKAKQLVEEKKLKDNNVVKLGVVQSVSTENKNSTPTPTPISVAPVNPKIVDYGVPHGRYLQVGAYSTEEKAKQVQDRVRKAGIRGSVKDGLDKRVFGLKIVKKGSNYAVVIGPATNDKPLTNIKTQVDKELNVNSNIVSL